MNTFLFMVTVMLCFLTDGIKDAIDHGKGAEPLYVLWHGVKRVNILLIGTCGTLLIKMGLTFSGLIALAIAFYVGMLCWNYVYYTIPIKNKLIEIDNTLELRTGNKWLDDWLGNK